MATRLGDFLRAEAERQNVSEEELGRAAGISASTVGQILRGEIERPPDQRLRGFARVLDGVSFDDLLNLIPENLREAQGPLLEALGEGTGRRWLVRVIRAGLSGNRRRYSDRVLREAAGRFDGARVFVKGDAEHLAGKGKDFRNLIGRLTSPRFVEGRAGPDTGELHAVFEVLESAGDVAAKLREAWDRGMTGLFGFSIDAVGKARSRRRGGETFVEANSIDIVHSVDLIVEPGAGGQIIKLIEALAEDTDMKLRDRMLKFIEGKRPDLLEGVDRDELEAEQLEEIYREALKGETPAAGAGDHPDPPDRPEAGRGTGSAGGQAAGVSADEVQRMLREAEAQAEARAYMREAVAGSNLPDVAKERLKRRFGEMESFKEADADRAIREEREYLSRFAESGHVADLGDASRIEFGETRADKVGRMLDAFFDRDNRDVRSFRECYVAVTGDSRVTGLVKNCDEALMRESLESGSFANVLGDSIHRRLVREYQTPNRYDIWQRIADRVPVNDFRTNERTRFGGYGDLPDVAEGAPYQALTSPTDEKATYAVKKKGGTEDITLEMIRNDDVGAVQRIPMKLSNAARRTLAKFVLDFIKDNPLIYDGLALFHASHGNLGSAALDVTALAAGRLDMLKQTELNSNDRLNIGPRSLLVAVDGEEAAVNLFRRSTENDRTFVQDLTLDVLPVWYWTDTNDWALAADPAEIPTIEIGFLDGNEEPELFVQDNPIVGSLFTHDKITYKLRHIYGGNVLDFRGLWKAVVA